MRITSNVVDTRLTQMEGNKMSHVTERIRSMFLKSCALCAERVRDPLSMDPLLNYKPFLHH